MGAEGTPQILGRGECRVLSDNRSSMAVLLIFFIKNRIVERHEKLRHGGAVKNWIQYCWGGGEDLLLWKESEIYLYNSHFRRFYSLFFSPI